MLSINIGRHYGDVGSGFVLQTVSYLGADDGVCIGHITKVLFPLLLPWLGAFHGVGMAYVCYAGTGYRLIGHGGEVISPVESGAQADGVGVVGADGVNDLLLEGFPLSPCAGACSVDGGLVEYLVEGNLGLVLITLGYGTPELECLGLGGVVHGRCVTLLFEVTCTLLRI